MVLGKTQVYDGLTKTTGESAKKMGRKIPQGRDVKESGAIGLY